MLKRVPRLVVHVPERLFQYVRYLSVMPPKAAKFDRFLYGLAQPTVGARIVLRDRHLLRASLYPAILLAMFCIAVALLQGRDSPERVFRNFYRVFAILAPLPSIVFARHYARLAATAHQKLGFGVCRPRLEGLGRAIRRAIFQAILVALAAAPVVVALRFIPVVGPVVVKIAAALWALHWVVIDAFDDARVLEGSETLDDVDAKNKSALQPWFVRGYSWLAERLPAGWIFRRFSHLGDRLSLEWREEMAVAESHPVLISGFGLTTALLLATPVLNLFFRPFILVASVHLLGHLAREESSHETKS